jgi:tRNA threonylcarbamoyladenosine biosynthesis protein TsaB
VTLALDASTYAGTVAVARDGRCVAERAVAMRGRDEERLMPAVAAALADAGTAPADVRRVVCGGGPGSFTSLRIAASIAKGLAMGLDVPLLAVSSLALAAVEAGEGRWLVTIDALRGELFAAGFRWDGTQLEVLGEPALVAAPAVARLAADIGAQHVSGSPHARAAVALLSSDAIQVVDRASWEPAYGRLAEAQVRWEAAQGRSLTP